MLKTSLQIRENVNKRIGMCENLVLFCLTSPKVEKEKKKGTVDINNNKGDQVSSIAAIWSIYHHMIMGTPEENVESQHSYCPDGDKTWCKYHKDKIFN